MGNTYNTIKSEGEGQGIEYYAHGSISYTGGYKDGKYHGHGSQYSFSGSLIYQGMFHRTLLFQICAK